MPTAHVNDVDLAYELRGAGPRLLVLLGSGMTLAGARPLLSLVGKGCTQLAFDYRGLGASTASPGPYDMAACAADALGVLDAVGWDTARVVGVSFGGMVAQELAVTAPQRVERLALLCTSAGGGGGSSYPLHELEDLDPGARADVRRSLLDDRFDENWLAGHPGDRALVEFLDRRDVDDDPRRWWRAAATTRSPPCPTARPSPRASPAPSWWPTTAATPSSCRTGPPWRTSSPS